MKQKLFIIEQSNYFQFGQEVDGLCVENGAYVGEHYLPKEQFIPINEALTKADEEKIRRMVREMLKKMFWRLYTRSAFIVK